MAIYITPPRHPDSPRLTTPETQHPASVRGTTPAKCHSLDDRPARGFRESTFTFCHDSFRDLSHESKTHSYVHLRNFAGSCVYGLSGGGSAATVALLK
jgi:hypothetical protein